LTIFALSAYLIPLGLSLLPIFSWFAKAGYPGLSYLVAWAVITLALFLTGVANIPLHFAAWGLTALAAIGFLKYAFTGNLKRIDWVHPLAVLPVFILAVMLFLGPTTYGVYAWDEWVNWIGWSRQIVVTDVIYSPEMWVATRGDTPGWTLAMALPGLISGNFYTEDAWIVGISLHVGLLAFFYDIARRTLENRIEMSGAMASLAAWAFILILMSVELSWRLIPSLLLIEEPQYYFLAAGFLTIAVGVLDKQRSLMLAGGTLLMATAWLFKTSFIVYAPSFALSAGFLIFFRETGGRIDWANLLRMIAAIAFIVALMTLWSITGTSARCQASIGDMVTRLFADGPVSGGIPFNVFAGQVFQAMLGFGLAWKLPITLAAVVGFVLFLRQRIFWVFVFALTGMWFAFYLGVLSGMAACFTEYEISKLASVERYTRVPLRLMQTIGLFALLFGIAIYIQRSSNVFVKSRIMTFGVIGLVILLSGFQIDRATRAINHVEARTNVEPTFKRRVLAAIKDVEFVSSLKRDPRKEPPGILYFIGAPFVERVAANFHGLGHRRGQPIHRIIADSYDPANGGKTYRGLTPSLDKAEVIVIVGSPVEAIAVFPKLEPVIKGCKPGNEGYLLWREIGKNTYSCLPRSGS